MGKRSLFLIVLTLFCLVEEIKATIKCHRVNPFSTDVIILCKPDYIMNYPVTIDKIESGIKDSLTDIKLEKVDQL